MSLGTMLYLNFVLGTMEMHWMLASFIRKVFSPCDYWSQALMINKTKNSHLHHHQCYFGNKYLSHAYFSCIQPCVGCPLGMKTLNVQLLWRWLLSSLGISLWYVWWECKSFFLQLVLFICDTCCLSQSIFTISCSLSDMWDVFDIFEVHSFTIRWIWAMCYAFKQ